MEYYKKGNISKANEYFKKIPDKQDTTCIKNLSKSAKTAYRKLVKQYKTFTTRETFSDTYIWGYYLADLDGDKKAELMIRYGCGEADVQTKIYTYKNGKVKKVADGGSSHESYYVYPGHKGVIRMICHQGESMWTMSMNNGKIVSKYWGFNDQSNDPNGIACTGSPKLYNHVKYKSGKQVLDLKDLE
ncbi:MAG: hypothetical protein ACI4HI_14695 [Lachnospiraceae bacterium]